MIGFGSDPSDARIQSSHGAGATASLMTQCTDRAVLDEDDCTFTTAQSPCEFVNRQVDPDPINSAVRAVGATMPPSAALRAACAVMRLTLSDRGDHHHERAIANREGRELTPSERLKSLIKGRGIQRALLLDDFASEELSFLDPGYSAKYDRIMAALPGKGHVPDGTRHYGQGLMLSIVHAPTRLRLRRGPTPVTEPALSAVHYPPVR